MSQTVRVVGPSLPLPESFEDPQAAARPMLDRARRRASGRRSGECFMAFSRLCHARPWMALSMGITVA
jgi:hypothetical protein